MDKMILYIGSAVLILAGMFIAVLGHGGTEYIAAGLTLYFIGHAS